jgi:uncharacterized protein (TIGR02246 family)
MRLAPLAFALFMACASADVSREAEVRAAMSGFMTALNALDADGMASYFADDMTAFFPVAAAERQDGKAAIVGIFQRYVEATKQTVTKTNIVPEDLRVAMRGDVAIVTFNVHNPAAVSRRTFVFERRAGRWLIVHMHASNYRTAP